MSRRLLRLAGIDDNALGCGHLAYSGPGRGPAVAKLAPFSAAFGVRVLPSVRAPKDSNRGLVSRSESRQGVSPVEVGRFVVGAHLKEGRAVAELARAHGVHRSWVYTLVRRYRLEGEAGLKPRSRRPPKTSPSLPQPCEPSRLFRTVGAYNSVVGVLARGPGYGCLPRRLSAATPDSLQCSSTATLSEVPS